MGNFISCARIYSQCISLQQNPSRNIVFASNRLLNARICCNSSIGYYLSSQKDEWLLIMINELNTQYHKSKLHSTSFQCNSIISCPCLARLLYVMRECSKSHQN
eukprot:394001_1